MKLFHNLSQAVVESLHEIFVENRYADKVIEKVLKQNPKWGARDRRFIAETTYDIVRWHRLFSYLIDCDPEDFWRLLQAWCVWNKITMPDWEEFPPVDKGKFFERYDKIKNTTKIRESIPDWLDDLGRKEIGRTWDGEIQALNEQAKVVLRVNTLKIQRHDLQKQLEEEQIETNAPKEFPDALILDERQNIFTRQQFKDGLFEVQDAGSQMIAPFLQVSPGQRVIDACAGAGGKTLHLASLLNNKGRIIAMDTEGFKLEELKKRARRAGASDTIETRAIDSSKVIKRLENSADRVLLDVPCSGLGVIRRNPDAKWKLSSEFIEKVKVQQQTILNDYSTMLKVGGLMVYSTCSILPSENEGQVEQFMKNHEGKFELQEQKSIMPSEGFDGFYMARMKRISR
ncbi:MAG: class I SAM-dependent methyltransferase [Cyclobacteriaceae bacterium]|nr:class I SAM-dependent methyltransferase [Cyclobacteriaceae bacterium]